MVFANLAVLMCMLPATAVGQQCVGQQCSSKQAGGLGLIQRASVKSMLQDEGADERADSADVSDDEIEPPDITSTCALDTKTWVTNYEETRYLTIEGGELKWKKQKQKDANKPKFKWVLEGNDDGTVSLKSASKSSWVKVRSRVASLTSDQTDAVKLKIKNVDLDANSVHLSRGGAQLKTVKGGKIRTSPGEFGDDTWWLLTGISSGQPICQACPVAEEEGKKLRICPGFHKWVMNPYETDKTTHTLHSCAARCAAMEGCAVFGLGLHPYTKGRTLCALASKECEDTVSQAYEDNQEEEWHMYKMTDCKGAGAHPFDS